MDENKSNSPALKAEQAYRTDVEKAEDYVENFDILETITNVGNDEVFTPVKTCRAMLDALPADVWNHPEYKWLNPATKNGVFEREIAIRLNESPAIVAAYPDELERKKHILTDMIFALGETKFTARVARRTLYYCDDATRKCDGIRDPNDGHFINGFAIGNGTWFDRPEGNILNPIKEHAFGLDHKCKYCGIARTSKYNDENQVEHYAYDFIHMTSGELQAYFRKEFFKGDWNMHFDIIIGNPPYQLDDGGNGASARPIYQLFIKQAIELKPKYLSMIVPSRWYAGGKGLDDFRSSMLKDKHISTLVDYVNGKDCFPSSSVGGVCYFVWDSLYNGACLYKNIHDGKESIAKRKLDEFPVFVRYNEALSVIHKVSALKEPTMVSVVGTRNPFGLSSSFRGSESKTNPDDVLIYSSGGTGYIPKSQIRQGASSLPKYKVVVSALISEHAGEPAADGTFTVISTIKLLGPHEGCTDSYIVVYEDDSIEKAKSCLSYLKTKFLRFLLLQAISSIHVTRDKFLFVPKQEFTMTYTDPFLYEKYGLSKDEVDFIETLIKEKQ